MSTPSDVPAAIAIPQNLQGCHPLVAETLRILEKSKLNDNGALSSDQTGILKVIVSPALLQRALRIMEAILRACVAHGWTIEGAGTDPDTSVKIWEDSVSFRLVEKLERYETEASKKKKSESWYSPDYRYRITGLLALQITDHPGDGARSTWGDGKYQRLEKILPDFIEGLDRASYNIRIRRIRWATFDHAQKDAERLRQEREAQTKNDAERREALFSQSEGLRRATEIRELVRVLNEKIASEGGRYDRTAVLRWCDWALGIAASLDPFENGYFDGLISKSPAYGPELNFEGALKMPDS